MYNELQGGQAMVAKSLAEPQSPSLKSRLEWAVKQAEQALAEAKRAREILDQHPELEELLNIMQRGRF